MIAKARTQHVGTIGSSQSPADLAACPVGEKPPTLNRPPRVPGWERTLSHHKRKHDHRTSNSNPAKSIHHREIEQIEKRQLNHRAIRDAAFSPICRCCRFVDTDSRNEPVETQIVIRPIQISTKNPMHYKRIFRTGEGSPDLPQCCSVV